MNLKEFENNIKSQFGEDGVIEEIFKRIGSPNKICIEFGAWDGTHLSNTWNLWHNKDWGSLLVEGDKEKYKLLQNNLKEFKNVKTLNAYVSFEGENKLDNIFKSYNYPKDIDLLSIDIDGDDYYIFESLSEYFPRLIIVEYNPTIPPEVDIIQVKGGYFGSSALSLLKLAHKKGYKLAHVTDTNMFFVINSCFAKLGFEEPRLSDIFITRHLVHVISSYDGKTFIVGNSPYAHFKKMKSKYRYPEIINTDSITIEKSLIHII